jgi:putative endonuclease
MYYTYILKSYSSSSHYYIGYTHNIETRLIDHNSGLVKSTKRYMPWKLIYFETYETKSEARLRELQIKSYKGGLAFKELIKDVADPAMAGC